MIVMELIAPEAYAAALAVGTGVARDKAMKSGTGAVAAHASLARRLAIEAAPIPTPRRFNKWRNLARPRPIN